MVLHLRGFLPPSLTRGRIRPDLADMELTSIADVLIPLALDTAYSATPFPPAWTLEDGDVVQVPLGPRETVGVVWSLRARRAGGNLKRVDGQARRAAAVAGAAPLRRLGRRVHARARGSVLRMVLRSPDEQPAGAARVGVRLAGPPPKRDDAGARPRARPRRRAARSTLKRDLADAAGVSAGVVDGLLDEGTLETVALLARAGRRAARPGPRAPDLSAEQRGRCGRR